MGAVGVCGLRVCVRRFSFGFQILHPRDSHHVPPRFRPLRIKKMETKNATSNLVDSGNGGDVIFRIYVTGAPAALVMHGFYDQDPEIINREADPGNPLLSVAPTPHKINDASSPLLTSLAKDAYYDVELQASAFSSDTVSEISHAVLKCGKIVPALINNKIANRKSNGGYKSVGLGKAKHLPVSDDMHSAKFSIEAL